MQPCSHARVVVGRGKSAYLHCRLQFFWPFAAAWHPMRHQLCTVGRGTSALYCLHRLGQCSFCIGHAASVSVVTAASAAREVSTFNMVVLDVVTLETNNKLTEPQTWTPWMERKPKLTTSRGKRTLTCSRYTERRNEGTTSLMMTVEVVAWCAGVHSI